MNDQKDYLNFIEARADKSENCGRSFTYGNAMYDRIQEWRWSFADLWIDDVIEENVIAESWANRDWVQWLSDEILAELVDVSLLDELGREISANISEEEKEEMFDELDGEDFENIEEVIAKIKEIKNNYYIDDNAEDLADEYANDRDLYEERERDDDE